MPPLNFNAITGEVDTPTIQDYELSFFNSMADFAPRTITLAEFRDMVRDGRYISVIERVRKKETAQARKTAKEALPAVTVSGVFSGGRQRLIHHSGLICLNFNDSENDNMANLFNAVAQDQFSLLTFRSASGTGLAVVCRIERDRHDQAFLALCEYYAQEYGLNADRACHEINRLRFLSYDVNIQHNSNARLFRRYSLVPAKDPLDVSHHASSLAAGTSLFFDLNRIDPTDPLSRLYEDFDDSEIETTREYQLCKHGRQSGLSEDECLDRYWGIPSSVRDEVSLSVWRLATRLAYIDHVEAAALQTPLPVIQASVWVLSEEAPREPILDDLFDAGDMLEIIAPSKMRKSFFAMQMAISCAAGCRFLNWSIPQARRVLYVNFEVKAAWQHRRLNRMVKSMCIRSDELKSLYMANTRGLALDNIIEAISGTVREVKPDVIFLDPLYMLHDGDENAAHDMKPLLRQFMALMAEYGAALVYIHHDAKGTAGDRNIRDRGAGSGIWGRGSDARIILTEHASEPDHICVDAMPRNFPPIEGFVVDFCDIFRVVEDVEYAAKTSRDTKKQTTLSIKDVCNQAMGYLANETLDLTEFRESVLRGKLGLSRKQAYEVINKLLESGEAERSIQVDRRYNIGTPPHIQRYNNYHRKVQ